MGKCEVCGKQVLLWQRKKRSMDKVMVAHKECLPDGFHTGRKIKK
jgi:hypothetical protein